MKSCMEGQAPPSGTPPETSRGPAGRFAGGATKTVLAAGLVALALAACGGGSSGSGSSQPAGSIKVTMTEFKFDPSSISVKPGASTFFLVNSGTVPHDMVIVGPTGNRLAASELVQAGNSGAFTVSNLTAGSYTFICDQPGHEASGMKGTLSVG